MDQPVILCGLGKVGWTVLDFLKTAGLSVVAIDLHVKPTDSRLAGVRFIQGDCRQKEVLEEAGLAKARGVIIITSDDLINISATLLARSLHPDVRIVVRLFNENMMLRLGKAVKNVVPLSVPALTAPVMAVTALTGKGLGTFSVADGVRQIAEIRVGETPVQGQTLEEIGNRYGVLVLAHRPALGADRFLAEVDWQARPTREDRLVVCGKPEALAPLLGPTVDDRLSDLRWASWLRRSARIAGRTLSEVDLAVKIATAILLLVIVAGTLVYHYGMNLSVPRGLFRTISLLATGADMHEEELTEGWQRVFASLMRLVGTALIATFTAIVTNYLLRARLGPALELRRIPDSGHIIVCGLGNIGYGVVQELRNRGEPVVVIERAADNRFIGPARRLGAAVIVGDGTVLEVLRQAHADSARAIIAATDSELANMEIALLVRELNPKQRVVTGVADPRLAQVLREAANIRLAVSTSALAAPAFVATLFGDRVASVFLIAGRVLAAIELAVQAGDPSLAGHEVGALAHTYSLVPISLVTADGVIRTPPPDHRLSLGDSLAAILSLPDLARLLRRERAKE
jgi:Trk K+ transport system NAD-binding subunit